MIATALIVSIVLGSAALMVAYALGALWLPVFGILILGVLWVVGQRLRWTWMASVMVVLCGVAAAVGAWLELNAILLVVGLIGALSAWDLDHFTQRLRAVDSVGQERALKRRHLQRLLAADGLGLVAVVLAVNVQIKLSFGLAIALGLIALLGLSLGLRPAIRFLRRGTD